MITTGEVLTSLFIYLILIYNIVISTVLMIMGIIFVGMLIICVILQSGGLLQEGGGSETA